MLAEILDLKELKQSDMTEKEKENRIHGFALSFLERQQIIPNLYADQIIRGYKDGYHQAEKDLKVKEVDLEKEFDNYTKNILACDVRFEPFTHLYNCAKYFFELGLKAQKGE